MGRVSVRRQPKIPASKGASVPEGPVRVQRLPGKPKIAPLPVSSSAHSESIFTDGESS